MKKTLLTILALITVFSLMLTGCGSKEAAETTIPATAAASAESLPLGLKDFSLSTSTWSSPNGATVHLSAVPQAYEEGQSAAFLVCLAEETVAEISCTWNGTAYTADAELNAADGYTYYVTMTAPNGTTQEFPVNTPEQPTDETLLHMAESLNSYCTLTVDSTDFADGKLTISTGSVYVQAPKITNEGESISCQDATLVLSFDGTDVATQSLTLVKAAADGGYELSLNGTSFDIPEMENDQQLQLTLNVTLTNGQALTCAGGVFFYNEGQLLTAVG